MQHDATPQLGLFSDEPVEPTPAPKPTPDASWWHQLPRADRIEQALEWSADDPDADHPAWMLELLAASAKPGWSKPPVPIAAVPAPVVQAMELDLFAATPMEAEPTEEEALDSAMTHLANALARKGELPTMDDCHRKRFGLPGMSAFNRAGGWHAVLVRFQSELCA